MSELEKKNHVIHELIFDLSFGAVNLPDKLQECINNIQRTTGSKRELLIQQAIGYTVAMKDFNMSIMFLDAVSGSDKNLVKTIPEEITFLIIFSEPI